MATKAYVLVTLDPTKTKNVIKTLQNKAGVKGANLLLGRYDAILTVEGKTQTDINENILSNIRTTEGVKNTETLVIHQ